MFFVYDALVTFVVRAFLVPWEMTRILLHRSRWRDLRERLGFVEASDCEARRVVLHAVSAGEVMATRPLLRELQGRGARIVLSTGNRAGRDAAERLQSEFPAIERVCWLPWDRSRAMRRWLLRLKPAAVGVVDTELWPNLFRACADQGVRLLVVNGRVYPRDVRRYRVVRGWMTRVLAHASRVGVQDETERDRFLAIGAAQSSVEVLGNLKIDAALDLADAVRPTHDGLMFVGGSTHAPEERLLIDACASLRSELPHLRLVLAPRDVSRAAQIRADAAASGVNVTVIDRVGLLPQLYAEGDVAFVGGTIAAIGGHNVLEPVAAGTAVIVGPHTTHIDATLRPFGDCITRVEDGRALAEAVARLLRDDAARASLAERAIAVLRSFPRCADAYAEMLLRRE